MKKVRFSSCPRAKVWCQGPLGAARVQPKVNWNSSAQGLTALSYELMVDSVFKCNNQDFLNVYFFVMHSPFFDILQSTYEVNVKSGIFPPRYALKVMV